MAKGSTQTATTTQTSTTDPWSAAQPLLKSLLGRYGELNTGVTSDQSNALSTLGSEASGVPEFNTSAPINDLLSSSTAPQVGMLQSSLASLKSNLAPTVDPNNLNPMNTPGLSDALGTLTNDITNQVKGVYAGSGRDPSGAGSFAQSLGRGLMQGEAPVIASQFNTNRAAQNNAAGMLNSAENSTAGAITAQNQIPLANEAQALGLIPAAATAATTPGSTQLQAANAAYSQPFGNLAAILQPALGFGSLGSSSEGTGTNTQTKQGSTFGNIMGGLMGGVGMLGQMGAFGPTGWLLASDERVKDDVEEVGRLHDGQKVVRFRYKGEPTTRIGLLAQEVQEHEPDAVGMLPMGILAVDHKKATDRAAAMGQRAA